MEHEGCKWSLNSLLENNISIRCLTTDRHITVTARMRSDYPKIKHQYDVWHLSKWVTKKLLKKAENMCSTCNGDPELLREKWVSILHHIVNKHKWNDYHVFHQCGHPEMSTREMNSITWLYAGSPSHIVTNNKLLKDLAMLTEFYHTGELEQYYSLMLKYLPKREHFSLRGMVARTQLTPLDHNWNVNRNQAMIKKGPSQGEKRFNVVCPKQRKNWVSKLIKEQKWWLFPVHHLTVSACKPE